MKVRLAFMANHEKQQERTIAEFGAQWLHYTDSAGFYASMDLLKDICEPLVGIQELAGKRIMDIGSGTGRFVELLLQAGASYVTAVEPSQAVQILRQRSEKWQTRVTIMERKGDAIPPGMDMDFVFCIGVLHHIPEPLPTLRAAIQSLRPGGKILLWVYGREGIGVYLIVFRVFRFFLKPLPDALLRRISRGLSHGVRFYMKWCQAWPSLPLAEYLGCIFANLTKEQQELIIFDQLNPSYAHYYRREEICDLMRQSGFVNAAMHRRHGYSWSVIAERPGKKDLAGQA